MSELNDLEDEVESWTHYNEYILDQLIQESRHLLDHFPVQGPGPPPSYAPHQQGGVGGPIPVPSMAVGGLAGGLGGGLPPWGQEFPPSPPVPGTLHQCLQFSSHFHTCNVYKEPTSALTPSLHLLSVIVAVFCVIILVSCITIFLIWKRRQKKSHLARLQYRLSDSTNFEVDFTNRRTNKYGGDPIFQGRLQMECQPFFLDNLSHSSGLPIYEEISNSCSPTSNLQHQLAHRDFSMTSSGGSEVMGPSGSLEHRANHSSSRLMLVPSHSSQPLLLPRMENHPDLVAVGHQYAGSRYGEAPTGSVTLRGKYGAKSPEKKTKKLGSFFTFHKFGRQKDKRRSDTTPRTMTNSTSVTSRMEGLTSPGGLVSPGGGLVLVEGGVSMLPYRLEQYQTVNRIEAGAMRTLDVRPRLQLVNIPGAKVRTVQPPESQSTPPVSWTPVSPYQTLSIVTAPNTATPFTSATSSTGQRKLDLKLKGRHQGNGSTPVAPRPVLDHQMVEAWTHNSSLDPETGAAMAADGRGHRSLISQTFGRHRGSDLNELTEANQRLLDLHRLNRKNSGNRMSSGRPQATNQYRLPDGSSVGGGGNRFQDRLMDPTYMEKEQQEQLEDDDNDIILNIDQTYMSVGDDEDDDDEADVDVRGRHHEEVSPTSQASSSLISNNGDFRLSSGGDMTSSDVTMSASSSETYPKSVNVPLLGGPPKGRSNRRI